MALLLILDSLASSPIPHRASTAIKERQCEAFPCLLLPSVPYLQQSVPRHWEHCSFHDSNVVAQPLPCMQGSLTESSGTDKI